MCRLLIYGASYDLTAIRSRTYAQETVGKENTVLLWLIRPTRNAGIFFHDALREQVLDVPVEGFSL